MPNANRDTYATVKHTDAHVNRQTDHDTKQYEKELKATQDEISKSADGSIVGRPVQYPVDASMTSGALIGPVNCISNVGSIFHNER